MPSTEATTGLPRLVLAFRWNPFFYIPYDGLFMFSFQLLSEDYGIEIAPCEASCFGYSSATRLSAPVSLMGPEGEYAVVEIDQVGMIFVIMSTVRSKKLS